MTMISQLPISLECFPLRRFGISFDAKPYGLSRGKKLREQINKEIDNLEIEYHTLKSLKEEDARRTAIRKYLLPQSGRTSIMNDFYNRF
jgi:hypothetical protein